jgi:hypothetical protein
MYLGYQCVENVGEMLSEHSSILKKKISYRAHYRSSYD